MYLKQLVIKNYGPFKGEHVINFSSESSVIFIQGFYEDVVDQSNRAGKSSFVECILYLLFGETKDTEVKLIHHGETEMTVSGTLVIEGKEITVKRGRTIENKPIFEVEGILGHKKDRDKELAALIGMSSKDFVNTQCFKQNDMHGFMKTLPSEKKKLLQGWFNLEHWKIYEDRASIKKKEYSDKLQKLENTKSSTAEQLRIQTYVKDEPEINAEIDAMNLFIQQSKKDLLELRLKFENLPNASGAQLEINILSTKLAQCTGQIQTLLKKSTDLLKDQKTATENHKQAQELRSTLVPSAKILDLIQVHTDLLISATKDISNVQNELGQATELYKNVSCFGGICPVDKKACDKGTRIPDLANSLSIKIKELEHSLNSLKANRVRISDEHFELQCKHNESSQKENRLNRLLQTPLPDSFQFGMQQIEESYQLLDANRVVLEDSLSKAKYMLEGIDPNARLALINKIEEEEKGQKLIEAQINLLNTELGRLRQIKDTRARLKKELEDLDVNITQAKKDFYRWSYITWACGKDGIPSVLIENKLSQIEEFTNDILDTISNGFSIEFQTTRELANSKETHCNICGALFGTEKNCSTCGLGFKRNKIKDEIDLKILYSGQEISFELDSGGGQVLISLALRLALSKVLSARTKKCEILILDEIFGSLDSVNKELVSKVIFNELKTLMGFRQIFVITHCTLNNYPYEVIKIIRNKSKNCSRILVENK